MELNRFSVSARLEYIPQSIDSFITLCEGLIASVTNDPTAQFFLKNAIDEFTTNAMEHGYLKSSGVVTVNVERHENYITLEILDNGVGIDLSKVRFDREARSYHDLTARGWSFSILSHIATQVSIKPNEPSGTIVTLAIPLPLKI
jgi:anti-sigma regulatory factor (Ser/Thr protein kinase)